MDDIILFSNDKNTLHRYKNELLGRFHMKNLGKIHYCFGMRINRNRNKKKYNIRPATYIGQVLKRFGMHDSKPVTLPIEIKKKYHGVSEE